MYAIIETGGKQYKVSKGDVVFVEKLVANEEELVEFKVAAICDESGFKVGTPYIDGAKVSAKVVKNGKGKKITVFTYKPKKSEKRKMGHRQPYSKVEILDILSWFLMIKIDFYMAGKDYIKGFCVSGHSGYAKTGSDIVCASVSSAVYMAANTMTDVINADADIEVRDGYIYFMLQPKYISSCHNILLGLKLHLATLEEQYPKNISVNYMEV